MTNDETRMTNECPKVSILRVREGVPGIFRFLRHSCFGIRHSEHGLFKNVDARTEQDRIEATWCQMTGLITSIPIARSFSWRRLYIASSSYVPTMAPPEPENLALAPTERAASTISMLRGEIL